MNNDEFRYTAHKFVDWIADFFESIEDLDVMPKTEPGDIKQTLPLHPPAESENMEEIFKDFQKLIIPGITHWQHPSFFAYFPANSSPPSVLAEMLTAAIGAQCMSWQTSPAATELEEVVMNWLKEMLDLPSQFSGVIQDTASTSTLCALISAREKITSYSINQEGFIDGCKNRKLSVYTSEQAHSSIEKGAKIAGFGKEYIRLIPVDQDFRMIPEKLEKVIINDQSRGIVPCCVVAAIGTTSTLSIDPLRKIGEICKKHNIWLHVDAAMAGTAAVLPEKRWILDGIEYADSFVFNPHKWMFTNFDCSAYFCRDPKHLVNTFSINPEYLKTDVDMRAKNYRDWGIPLGRRFRALKLWFVIRSYGVHGLRKMIAKHIQLAEEFAGWLKNDGRFELIAPQSLNLVCFRFKPQQSNLDEETLNAINKNLMDELNKSGKLYLSHTVLNGKFTLRLCVGQTATEHKHIENAWNLIKNAKASA